MKTFETYPERALTLVSELTEQHAMLVIVLFYVAAHLAILLTATYLAYVRRDWLARVFALQQGPFDLSYASSTAAPHKLKKLEDAEKLARIDHHANLTTPPEAATSHLALLPQTGQAGDWTHRPLLPPVVHSRTRSYRIVEQLGRGDLSQVDLAEADDQHHALKTAMVSRGEKLLLKEHRILQRLQDERQGELSGEYFPVPTETFRCFAAGEDRLVTAYQWRQGYRTATEIRQRYPAGVEGRHLAWMFNRLLEALGLAHNLNWVHGAVLPQHLMFHPDTHGLQLIGWIHAERCQTPLRVVSRTMKAWYPPESRQRRPATPATDIYLAAMSIVWLAGGDPLTHSIPLEVPGEFRNLLGQCLADKPGHRPQIAWELHEQFKELLDELYGPPKFCHFNMS